MDEIINIYNIYNTLCKTPSDINEHKNNKKIIIGTQYIIFK
jgi:hypothetical protein